MPFFASRVSDVDVLLDTVDLLVWLATLLGRGLLASLPQLAKLDVDEAIASLLGLHQLEAIKVRQLLPLFAGSDLLRPGALLPLLVDVGLLPRLLDETGARRVRVGHDKLG